MTSNAILRHALFIDQRDYRSLLVASLHLPLTLRLGPGKLRTITACHTFCAMACRQEPEGEF